MDSNKEIVFCEKGEERENSGKKLKAILIITPFLVFGIVFLLRLYFAYNLNESILKECSVTSDNIVEIQQVCLNDNKYCAENDCITKEFASANGRKIINAIYRALIAIILLAVFWFSFFVLFGDKNLSETIRWVKLVIYSVLFALLLLISGLLSPGILSIYLVPAQIIIGAFIAMAIFRYNFYSALLISLFSWLVLLIVTMIF